MRVVTLAQRSPEWLAYRANQLNASDAPKMLGESSYISRNAFIRQRLLEQQGVREKPAAFLARKFEEGNLAEEAARPRACEIVGEDLFPVVGEIDGDALAGFDQSIAAFLVGRLSASFDGLTFDHRTVWEHKLFNEKIAADVASGVVPAQHRIQMEQQMLIAGASRGLFMASNADGNSCHLWVEPDMTIRERILRGWIEFLADFEKAVHEVVDATENAQWLGIERELWAAEAQLKAAKSLVDEIRNRAIKFSAGRRVTGSGYELVHSVRKGSIDYAKAIKDSGMNMDLEEYRAEPVKVCQIKRVAK